MDIFRELKTISSSTCNKIGSRIVQNRESKFSLRRKVTQTPFTRSFLYYMAGPLLKSRRRL